MGIPGAGNNEEYEVYPWHILPKRAEPQGLRPQASCLGIVQEFQNRSLTSLCAAICNSRILQQEWNQGMGMGKFAECGRAARPLHFVIQRM